MYDPKGRYLYDEGWARDTRRALRAFMAVGYSVLLFGGLGAGLAVALTGGL